jgi:OPA family glycerol-3-phosphate transporter-like MFS transporter/OPA family sugar phosphate sensor protein UhpC-like MFS transporter
MIIAFELAAIVGTIFAGWVTDKWFKGRGVRTCVFCMLFAALFAFGFWFLPQGAPIWQATVLLMGAGFCIYGPQALIGIIAANQATKEAAAMANGFAGIMGYLSTLVSGIGVAFMKEHYGWGAALCSISGFAIIGMILFLFAWNANATGYKRENKQ